MASATPKKPRLTKKQRGFIRDYIATENGTQAALANYDTKDPKTAGVIAVENLAKPSIKNAIADALKDEDLSAKHQQLLQATTMQKINFHIRDTDEDIQAVIDQMPGHKLLKIIRHLGKNYSEVYAYVSVPDSTTQDKALDKAYKIKGTYAPEKKIVGSIDLNDDDRKQADKAIREALG